MNTTRNSIRKVKPVRARTPVSSKPVVSRAKKASQNGNGHANGSNGHAGNGNGHTNGNGNASSAPVQTATLSQREQVMREREQVLAELARLRAELLETPEATGDEVDLSVYDREKTLGLVKAFERRLEKLDEALKATESGEYGICQRCKKPIDAERLKIFPETRHCVKCKTELEQQARQQMMH